MFLLHVWITLLLKTVTCLEDNWHDRTNSIQRDFCLTDEVNLVCEHGEILTFERVLFGRMSIESRCIKIPDGIGCHTDMTSHVEEKCLGHRNCSFGVHEMIPLTKQCQEYSSYMSVNYRCRKVLWLDRRSCNKQHTLSAPSGFISYSSAILDKLPSRDCPWPIAASSTQTLQFSVMHVHQPAAETCSNTVVFREGAVARRVDMCGAEQKTLLYNSSGNLVTIHFESAPPDGEQTFDYLLKYTVIGCPKLRTPAGGWVQQGSTTAKVQCNQTKETWFLTCKGNTWFGDFANCTHGAHSNSHEDTLTSHHNTHSLRLILAVLLGIVIGVLAGLILLTVVYYCYKKKMKHEYEQAEVPLDYFSECQQQKQQFYASMLRNKERQQYSEGLPDPLHQQQTEQLLLQCPHSDNVHKTASSICPAHALHPAPSPCPMRHATMTSQQQVTGVRAPVSEQTSVYHALPSFSSAPDCVQHAQYTHNRST